jgi:hypothetical protein
MTDRQKIQLKRIGELVALALGVIALTAFMKAGAESWLVARRSFDEYVYKRDSALAVWIVRDSVFKRDINEQLRELKLVTRRAR